MTAPARSTTHVVTDRSQPPRVKWLLLAVVAVVLLVAAVTAVRMSAPPHLSQGPASAGTQPLIVGDDRTVTLVSLGGPDTDAVLTRVAGDIGAAVTAVEDFWGTDWTHDILVVATGSDAQFAAQAGDAAGRFDTAAVAVADRVDPASHTVSGQRVVLAPGAAAMSDEALRIVLGHELFHYASRADTAVDAPRWLTEGVADYVGRPAPAGPVALTLTALPSDDDFTGGPAELSAAYDHAWLFARFVADRYGPQTLRRLYLRACGADHVDVPTALREVLGAGRDAVLAQWQQWARR